MVHEQTICQECSRFYVYVVGYESHDRCPACLYRALDDQERLEVELSDARFEAEDAEARAELCESEVGDLREENQRLTDELSRLRDLESAVRKLRDGDGVEAFPRWEGWDLLED